MVYQDVACYTVTTKDNTFNAYQVHHHTSPSLATHRLLLWVFQRELTTSQRDRAVHLATWWRHQMETFSALLALCAGNSPVSGEFPSQRPVTRSFDVFFDLRLNKRLSKQSWGWWFETPSCSLWRNCNETHGRFRVQWRAGRTAHQSYKMAWPRKECDRVVVGIWGENKDFLPVYKSIGYFLKT